MSLKCIKFTGIASGVITSMNDARRLWNKFEIIYILMAGFHVKLWYRKRRYNSWPDDNFQTFFYTVFLVE